MRKTFIIKGKNRGFALIATITLMVLLALLSVGLLTVASSQTRISQRGIFAAEARAQAKLAMEVAIGRLQCELGPDQRISANSGILDTSPDSETIDGVGNPYILGVWDSWGTWANRKNPSGLSLADTYSKGRKELFRSWLISSSLDRDIRDMESGSRNLGQFRSQSGEQKVQLLGEGTLGRRGNREKHIYAGLVQVDDASTPVGPVRGVKSSHRKSIAWWIGGENQKARINLPSNGASDQDEMAVLRATWNTPPPLMNEIEGMEEVLSNLPDKTSADYNGVIQKLISRDMLGLTSRSSGNNSYQSAYHDYTLDSEGILADAKFGGLKKDINILFSQEKLPEEFQNSNSDIGFRAYTTEDGSPVVDNRPIGSFNQLFYWANVWDPTIGDGQDISAKLEWDGKMPTTRVAADKEALNGMMNNHYTYMRQPILLKQYQFWGYQYFDYGSVGYNGGVINMWAAMVPVFVWWNPYNVPLRMEGANGEPWGSYFSHARIQSMLMTDNAIEVRDNKGTGSEGNDQGRFSENFLSPYYDSRSGHNVDPSGRVMDDFAATFRDTVNINDANIEKGDVSVLLPGEIVMFTFPRVKGNRSSIRNMKTTGGDRKVDFIPFAKGALQDNDDSQFSPYSFNMYTGWKYSKLSPTGNSKGNYLTYWLQFSEKYSNDKPTDPNSALRYYTPEDRLLASKYSVHYKQNKKMGAYIIAGGLMKGSMIGQTFQLGSKDPEIFEKTSPATLNLNWGVSKFCDAIQPPQSYWVMPEGASDADKDTGKGGHPLLAAPFFGAYFGVSVKWDSKPLLGVPPDDKEKNIDVRTKIWQHSSPVFWGGRMENSASELGKTYSPYQFELKQGINSLEKITLYNVISQASSDSPRMSTVPFAGPGSENIVNRIVATELPLHPPFSLAGFAGARLTPGWYDDGEGGSPLRFAYQSGVPSIGIGNSFADPMIPAESIFSSNDIFGDEKMSDFWDHALMVNDGLWDSWFTSSLSSRPSALGGGKEELSSVVKAAFDISSQKNHGSGENNKSLLPNSMMKPSTRGLDSEDVISELRGRGGYKKSAKYLTVSGAFNVNSTSSQAWKSVIMGLKNRRILAMDETGTPSVLDKDAHNTVFSRYGIASGKESHVDLMGSIGILKGIESQSFNSWSDLRKIDEKSMQKLAESIVSQVKKRGPFLNMAEFINRRLSSGEMGVKGALQAAIDNSGINDDFNQLKSAIISPTSDYPNREAAGGSIYTAAPGYLIQSDVLAVLGNILTTRDDTFVIRAYGEVSSKDGKTIISRAWCEAIVQRGIEYTSPVDSPEMPAVEVNLTTGKMSDSQLSSINRAFGRKFNIVAFKWLQPEEI